jgi:outer membrane protein assembly factor BamB
MRKTKLFVWLAVAAATTAAAGGQEWSQWGQNPQHTGTAVALGQPARHMLADVVYDPFVAQEQADPNYGGDLAVHYQAPLIQGDDVFMEFKSGTFTGVTTWETQIWNERRLHWDHGNLVTRWSFASDWKPVPFGSPTRGPAWEPVFHAVLSGSFVYVPGASGSIYKLRQSDGAVVAHVQPFGTTADPDLFLCGPLTVDALGNVYYNAIKLSHGNPWDDDVRGSWLVKVRPDGSSAKVAYAGLIPGAPAGNDRCPGIFSENQLPWPPSPDAVAPKLKCGTQRAAVNQAPAVAPDGTIYVASVAHLTSRTSYLVALRPDLSLKWAASLRDRFHDGCNGLLPPTGTPGGCRAGAHDGVDPAENRPGAGRIIEDSTASPVVLPDGGIVLGTYTSYNYVQGHLMKFSAAGNFVAAYRFGWDTTPSVYRHDGTYSIILKDNQYGDIGSYCDDDTLCPPDRTANNPGYPEAYFITQLSPNLDIEWRWQNTNSLSCTRDASGHVSCTSDHPFGFEWCVNAAAVDPHGVVYANSEDGNLYAIQQGGTLRDNLFLNLAIGAAYTPLSIDGDGKIYTQNDGHLFVVGN